MTRSIRKGGRLRERVRILIALAAALGMGLALRAIAEERVVAADTVVVLWNEAALQSVREHPPGPTVVARVLAVLHTCEFDAWTAYDVSAVPTVSRRGWRRPATEATQANKEKAVSFAAYRALVDLFPADRSRFDSTMTQLGYDPTDTSLDPSTAAGVGNAAAAAVLDFRHHDGSNQLGDLHAGAYSDYTGYQAVNSPTTVVDPNRWQPLSVVNAQGQPQTQVYTTPQWGDVIPFALTSGSALRPAPPASYPSQAYVDQANEILALSAGLTDLQKLTAEYFADGPSSEFPPGHWSLFAEFVSRRDHHTLDDDVKMFFALGNALLDASICAWDAKRAYDSERPGTAIHFLFAGQMVLAWGGPHQGTKLIPGEDWRPYQLSTVVTPPFPEYFSGHSIFSAAGAEILKSFTGSDAFGATALIRAGTSVGEPGTVPATDVTLSWATFSAAADDAGMSRRWGGIHFAQGDLSGRALGRQIGAMAWAKALTYIDGTAHDAQLIPATHPHPPARTVTR